MRTPQRWAVIGGGLVGTATALRLQAAGFETILIDRGDPRRGASFGNIGHGEKNARVRLIDHPAHAVVLSKQAAKRQWRKVLDISG